VNTTNTGGIDIYVVNYGSAVGPAVAASGFQVLSVGGGGGNFFGSFSVSVNNLNFNTLSSDYIGFVVNHNISSSAQVDFVIEATLFFQW